MPFDIRPLLDLSYWFTNQPPTDIMEGTGRFVFAGFVLLFVLGVIFRITNKHRDYDKYVKETISRISTMLMLMGLLGTMLFFFSFEQIPFFGAPFWYLFWGIGFLIWAGWVVRYVKVVIPVQKKQDKAKHKRNKYLPNTKRRQ